MKNARNDGTSPKGRLRVGQAARTVMDVVESILRVAALVGLIFAIAAFLFPSVAEYAQLQTAQRYGVAGFAYWELDRNRQTVRSMGDLFLLSNIAPARAQDLRPGDKLQAVTAVRFRSRPTEQGREMFLLKDGDCVVVTGKPVPVPQKSDPDHTGAWLPVSTSACGIFR